MVYFWIEILVYFWGEINIVPPQEKFEVPQDIQFSDEK
jgi:hypothetical protein